MTGRPQGSANARWSEERATICHLIDSNIDTAYFRSLATHHDRRRFRVLIGSVAPAGPLQDAMRDLDCDTFSLGASERRQYPFAAARLVSLLRRERVDILHAHCFDPTLLGIVSSRVGGSSVVFTRHHSDHNLRLGKRAHVFIDGWCGRHADLAIAVSEATRELMLQVERVPTDKVTVVHNGMDPLPRVSEEQVEALRRQLGLSGRRVCLMPARLHEEKGHRVLFAAVPLILQHVPDAMFLCAGDGPDRRALEAEIDTRGLSSSVRLLGQRSDMAELLTAAAVVVLPSLAESFGYAALEAMSCARPVVASRHGGLPEVVTDGETGLLVPPGDHGSLADAVAKLLIDRDLAARLGAAGRARASLFSAVKMVASYETAYERVLGS